MSVKRTSNARVIFALMVPLTCFSFLLGHAVESTLIPLSPFGGYDVAALLIVTVGVFVYNWYEEKPQEYSVENL